MTKRDELIDFLIWYDRPKVKDSRENAAEIIAEYEKSIKSNTDDEKVCDNCLSYVNDDCFETDFCNNYDKWQSKPSKDS